MKRFKDLTSDQQTKAIQFLSERELNSLKSCKIDSASPYFLKIKYLKDNIEYCGCINCNVSLFSAIQKDSLIKELIQERAISLAEEGYYPEDHDIIVKVTHKNV